MVANGVPRVSGDRPLSGWKVLEKSRSLPRRMSFFLKVSEPKTFQRFWSRSPQPASRLVR